MRRKRRGEGFSLLEVLIAMLMLVVIVLSLLPALGRSFQSYQLSQQRWRAAVEAWNQAERFRALSVPSPERFAVAPQSRLLERIVVEDAKFGIRWEVLHGQD
ncbi:MAG: prepilin-type N-terminal cleavage/methylation domain-containing protein [Acidobacteriota bacterium]